MERKKGTTKMTSTVFSASKGIEHTKACIEGWEKQIARAQKEKFRLVQGKKFPSPQFYESVLVWAMGKAEVQKLKDENDFPDNEEMEHVVDFMIRNRKMRIEEAKGHIKHNRAVLKRQEEKVELNEE
jgi:hypothetical protein